MNDEPETTDPEPVKSRMVRVYWRAETGKTGNGEPVTREVGEACVENLKRKRPKMRHWVEDVEDEDRG